MVKGMLDETANTAKNILLNELSDEEFSSLLFGLRFDSVSQDRQGVVDELIDTLVNENDLDSLLEAIQIIKPDTVFASTVQEIKGEIVLLKQPESLIEVVQAEELESDKALEEIEREAFLKGFQEGVAEEKGRLLGRKAGREYVQKNSQQ